MKPKFYFFLLLPVLVLASCTKWTPDANTNSIVGSWEITSVERQTPWGSEPAYTGYENGTFYFNNNGTARYSDGIGQMEGSWRMVQRVDGNSLELRLYDYRGDRVIEWEFYSVERYSSNGMVGYMTRFGEEYRFEFRRY